MTDRNVQRDSFWTFIRACTRYGSFGLAELTPSVPEGARRSQQCGLSGEEISEMRAYVWQEPALIGSSATMDRVRARIAQLAKVPWPIRIEGPTGTGKRIAAHLIHQWSLRSAGPFVACNINMLTDGLEVAELTGHVRGAFTGAISDRAGAFESAHGGSLFLDELATASSRVQQALLQLVEEGTVRRVGEERVRHVDTRLIFGTNARLDKAVQDGQFRADLYYRMGVLVVRMPALEEHREDIPELVVCILERKALEAGMTLCHPGLAEMDHLVGYDWPGNVRQLDRVLEHYLVFRSLPEEILEATPSTTWRSRIDEALSRHSGNKAAAARELGVSRQTLYEELRQRTVPLSE